VLLRVLLKTVGLYCCSEWFEQLYNRISNGRADGGFSGGPELVRCVWIGDDLSGYRDTDRRRVQSRNDRPLRHYTKFGHVSRKTLHRGSMCDSRK